MPPFKVCAIVVVSAESTQWPSDPTAELDFDEFLGLRDAPNRPPVARARMTLFRSAERTVAMTERWGSYPPIVDIISDRSAPVRVAKRSRKLTGETAPRVRDIASAPMSTASGRAEDEELLTTRAAALYCGYLTEVGIRKAKHDGLLASAGVGKNRSLLWRRSDLDAHNLRRGYVPSDAQVVGAGVVCEGDAGVGVGGLPAASAAGDSAPLPADVSPKVTAPVVEPILVTASDSSLSTDASDAGLASVEGHSPTVMVSESVEIVLDSCTPLADQSDSPSSSGTLVPATHDGEPCTATGGLVAVTTPAWRRRPLAPVLRVVLLWEVFAGASEPDVPAASPEVPPAPVIPSQRYKTRVPYRGALLARQRHRASG